MSSYTLLNLGTTYSIRNSVTSRTGAQQQHGIDRGADDLLAHHIHARLVVDVARERLVEVAGLLAGVDGGDVQRREYFRKLLQGIRQRMSFIQASR